MGLASWGLTESRDTPADTAQFGIDGRLEAVRDGVVSGWAWAPADPAARIDVSVLVDGEEVASTTADTHRRRLENAGIGDGSHAFEVALPHSLADGAVHRLLALAGPTSHRLPADRSFTSHAAPGHPFAETEFELPDAAAPASGSAERHGRTRRLVRVAPSSSNAPVWLLALASLAYVVMAVYLTRHFSFFQDDYSLLKDRRAWNANAFLAPNNHHLMVTLILIYKVLWATVGLKTFWPYGLPVFFAHVALVWGIYVLGRRRAGPWIALVPAVLMLICFPGFEDELWSVNISIAGALAAGVWAIVCLDRGDRRGDIWACALVALSIASHSVTLFLVFGIAIGIAVTNWRRLWVVVIPLLLYALWYAKYGVSDIVWSNLHSVPGYDLHIAGYGFAGLVGMSSATFGATCLAVGWPLLALAIGGLVVQAVRRRLTPLTIIGTLAALGFWTGTALARAAYGEPDASRYLYASAAFILLALAGSIRWWRVRREVSAALALAGAAIAAIGFGPMNDYASWRTLNDALIRVQLGAVEAAGPAATPSYLIDQHLLGGFTAADWFPIVRDLGSNAFGIPKVRSMPVWFQLQADATLAGSEAFSVRPGPEPRGASCVQVYPGQSPQTVSARPGAAVYVTTARRATASVWLRRVSDYFGSSPSLTLGRDTSGTIAFPRDRSSLPWSVGLTVPGHGHAPLAEICSLT